MRPGSGCAYQEACCHGMSAFFSPWTGCDSSGEGCDERKQLVDRSVAGLGGLSGLVGSFPFNLCCSVYTLYHFGMSVSFPTCVCV